MSVLTILLSQISIMFIYVTTRHDYLKDTLICIHFMLTALKNRHNPPCSLAYTAGAGLCRVELRSQVFYEIYCITVNVPSLTVHAMSRWVCLSAPQPSTPRTTTDWKCRIIIYISNPCKLKQNKDKTDNSFKTSLIHGIQM